MALVKIPLRKVSQADIARPWLGVIITNPLLGVQSFLSNFILTINYPEGFFTLENK